MLLFSLIPSGFSVPENVIYGSSYFEKLPNIEAGKTADFRLKMFYKTGPYSLVDLKPIIDVYPLNLAQYLSIKTETIEDSIHPVTYVLVKGNITAREDIPAGKVSLVFYFSAKDVVGNSYRSSWNESTHPIDIKNSSQSFDTSQLGINFDDPPLKQFRAGIPNEEIKCKGGLELLIKSSSGSPACVKPQSMQKLFELSWAIDVKIL